MQQAVEVRNRLNAAFTAERVLEFFWWQAGGKQQTNKVTPYWTEKSTPADVVIGFLVFVKRPKKAQEGCYSVAYLNSRIIVAPVGHLNSMWSAVSTNPVVPLDFVLKYTQREETILDLWCGGGATAIAGAFAGRNTVSVGSSSEVHNPPFV